MLLKYGVNPVFVSVLTDKFVEVDKIFQRLAQREAIITSGNDGRHGKNSFHYRNPESKGEATNKMSSAMDLRTRDMNTSTKQEALSELKKLFGNDFDIILETTHIHLEWDKD